MAHEHRAQRALLYRLLASAFLYPEGEVEQMLCSSEFIATLRAAATALGSPAVAECLDVLAGAVAAINKAPGLQAEYVALFTRNVPCSPYGSRYLVRDVMARPRVLEEVTRFYAAFGLQVNRSWPDLPDHAGMELEFLGYLLAKELHALEMGWDEHAAICREARARFLSTHLLLWFPQFTSRLREHARLAWYPAVAEVTLALLEDDAHSLGVQPDQVEVTWPQEPVPAGVTAGPVATHEEGDERDSTFDCGPISS